jgi:phosphoribosylanthranilate isomerase
VIGIKVCGIRSPEDALACVEAGVDTLGLNFWSGTPRCVDVSAANRIVQAVSGKATLVAVFVDASADEIARVRDETGIAWAQLHGDESPALLESLLPNAYKAVRVGGASVRDRVRGYPGRRILLDAAVPGSMPGGTGHTFDWSFAAEVAEERELVLAGGLTPENVADAVREVRPFQVDVASGVEQSPGVKDIAKVRAFVAAARLV